MKKILLAAMAVTFLMLASCANGGESDYKAKGEALAKQLSELCEKQDTAAVLQLDRSIRTQEEAIVASGDSAAIAAFREALKDARQQSAPYITTAKMQSGKSKDEALQDVINDALNSDVDIEAVSAATDAALQQQAANKAKNKK